MTHNSRHPENEWPSDDHENELSSEDHVRFEILLERHIDGDLSPKERDELFEHLEHCSRCQEILEAEEALEDHLSRVPRLMPPADLRARILREAVQQREQLISSWLPAEDDDDSVLTSPVHQRRLSRVPRAVQLFLIFSIVFFLLSVDLRSVPGLNFVQNQLKLVIHFVASQTKAFLQQRLPSHSSSDLETDPPNDARR